MKKFNLVVISLLLSFASFAQGSFPHYHGSRQFTIGIGLNSFEGSSTSLPPIRLGLDLGIHEHLSIEPYFQLSGSKEYWDGRYYHRNINERHTLYNHENSTNFDTDDQGIRTYYFQKDGKKSKTYADLGARFNLHWGNFISGLPTELDLYSGFGLGLQFTFVNNDFEQIDYETELKSGYYTERATTDWYDKTENYTEGPGFGWGLTLAGARYYFADNAGVFLEIGYNSYNLLIGGTFKL